MKFKCFHGGTERIIPALTSPAPAPGRSRPIFRPLWAEGETGAAAAAESAATPASPPPPPPPWSNTTASQDAQPPPPPQGRGTGTTTTLSWAKGWLRILLVDLSLILVIFLQLLSGLRLPAASASTRSLRFVVFLLVLFSGKTPIVSFFFSGTYRRTLVARRGEAAETYCSQKWTMPQGTYPIQFVVLPS